MMGFADMAMCLAEQRACARREGLAGFWTRHRIGPCGREYANPATHQVSYEYYQIIDRINRGEKP